MDACGLCVVARAGIRGCVRYAEEPDLPARLARRIRVLASALRHRVWGFRKGCGVVIQNDTAGNDGVLAGRLGEADGDAGVPGSGTMR
jgi:hypothetical protein